MKLDRVTLHYMALPYLIPFETSFSREYENHFVVVEVESEGVVGYGECVADVTPLYSEETTAMAFQLLADFLVPYAFGQELNHPADVTDWFRPVRRNKMAIGGLECAIWDLWAKRQNQTLSQAIGGVRQQVKAGVSVGINEIPTTLRHIEGYLAEGYHRIKVKIKPGHDVKLIAAIRERFGDVPLMADANSAYTLADVETLKQLDQFNLMMIEQPLGHDDIIDHAQLQPHLKTPICLDESIHSPEDARKAIELGACRIINIKIGRVGGLHEAKRVHDVCQERNVPVWCGGMTESGIGRAHNIAVATLPNFTIPGDISASSRYWREDIIQPAVTMSPNGMISVPAGPGIGYAPYYERFPRYTHYAKTLRP